MRKLGLDRIQNLVLIVGLVPNLIFIFIVTTYFLHTYVRAEEVRYRTSSLTQTVASVDQYLETQESRAVELYRYVDSILERHELRPFFSQDFGVDLRDDWFEISEVIGFMVDFVDETDAVRSMGFYNRFSQIGFDTDGGFIQPIEPRFLEALQHQTRRAEIGPTWSATPALPTEFGSPRRGLWLIQTNRDFATREVAGYVLVEVEWSSFQELFEVMYVPVGALLVTDSNDNVVIRKLWGSWAETYGPWVEESPTPNPVTEVPFLTSTVGADTRTSATGGWTYHLYYPKYAWLSEAVLPLFVILLAVNLLFLGLFILSRLVTDRISAPLTHVKKALAADESGNAVQASRGIRLSEIQEISHRIDDLHRDYVDEVSINQALRKDLEVLYPELKRTLVRDLVCGEALTPEMSTLLEEMGISEDRWYRVIVVKAHRDSDAREHFGLSVLSIIPSVVLYDDHSGVRNESVFIVASDETAKPPDQSDDDLYQLVSDSLNQEFGLQNSVLVSRPHRGVLGIRAAYSALNDLRGSYFSLGTGAHFQGRHTLDTEFSWDVLEKEFRLILEKEDLPQSIRWFRRFAELAEAALLPDTMVQLHCQQTIHEISSFLFANGSTDFDLAREIEKRNAKFHDAFDSLSEFSLWGQRVIARVFHASREQEAHQSIYTRKTKEFIHESYSKNIGMEDVADRLRISVPYLSKVFKDETGDSFKSYLTQFRIRKAKKLLAESSESVSAVADAVGYQNFRQFIRIFKKYEGATPGDFRKYGQT